ncbi:MAG: PDZ domain-containing protein [Rubripirellula sp.]|nr:PDZ domain-containing protein [Rubripirellula sp.]
MACRLHRVIFVFAALIGWEIVSPASADAQGLIQRIQNRIESRSETPAENPAAERDPATADGDQPGSRARSLLQSLLPAIAPAIKSAGDGGPSQPGTGSPPSTELNRGTGLNLMQPVPEGRSGGRPNPPSLGIQVLPTESGPPGLVVVSIENHSLADDAGLRINDIIIAMDGMLTFTPSIVAEQLQKKSLGDRTRLRFIRAGKSQEIEVALVKPRSSKAADLLPAPAPASTLPAPASTLPVPASTLPAPASTLPAPASTLPVPASVAGTWNLENIGIELTESANLRGMVVKQIKPGSPAEVAGMLQGDRIVALDGRLVSSRDALLRELSVVDFDETLSLKLVRNRTLVIADLAANGVPVTMAEPVSDGGAKETSPLGGIGSMLGGFFGGSAGTAEPKEPTKKPIEQPAKPEDDSPAAATDNGVTPAAFEIEVENNQTPMLAKDPPSLTPVGGLNRGNQLDELRRRERELQLELERLQRQIKELEAN